MVNVTTLVAAKSTFTLPVSCVEQGRWHFRSRSFESQFCAAAQPPPNENSRRCNATGGQAGRLAATREKFGTKSGAAPGGDQRRIGDVIAHRWAGQSKRRIDEDGQRSSNFPRTRPALSWRIRAGSSAWTCSMHRRRLVRSGHGWPRDMSSMPSSGRRRRSLRPGWLSKSS